MNKSIKPFKDIIRFDLITEEKITNYFKIYFVDNSIGLFNNEFTLIKTIRGTI